ncbi:MAG: peptidase S9 [Steroidobacteraceae bacterium]
MLSILALATLAATPFTAEDLVALHRVSDPQVSPDGRHVAYVIRETDLAANRGRTDLWLLDLGARDAAPRRLTQDPASDSSPRWAADGRSLYFLSTRSGSSQVWRLLLDGGEPLAVTQLPEDVGTFRLSPDGKRIVFSMRVAPAKPAGAGQDAAAGAPSPDRASASGMLFDRLFIRHWDTWSDGSRSHLFSATLEPAGGIGTPVDLSQGLDGDVPSKPFGGDEEYAISPDGRRVVFSVRIAGRTEAWSTNFDLYEARIDGSAPPANLTAANAAWDTQPVFLGNGDLAYLAMDRPGFEADRFQIVVRDAKRGIAKSITAGWDRSVSRLGVTADGRRLLATADDTGQHALFAIDPSTGKPTKLVGEGYVDGYSAARAGVVYSWASLGAPADLWYLPDGGEPARLTSVNAARLAARTLGDYAQFSFRGWNDEIVHGYVMKPAGFVPGRKYPIAFIVHGGPQSSYGNGWSYRWNPQVYAGHGYGVVFIDFHGSTGYGQAFTDSISGDWGGKPLVDLQKGLAAAIADFDWLDGERACSLGASYGGYMQNWIAGNWPDRFRCIVNHDGIFDNRSMYYSTEELWFPEWENGGPYFENPATYERWDPSRFVQHWRTPMLVIHGAKDYRVPDTQGIATFTALQRRGIESKLLYFPDENHWVLKPVNSLQWHATVLDWLDAHLREDAARQARAGG